MVRDKTSWKRTLLTRCLHKYPLICFEYHLPKHFVRNKFKLKAKKEEKNGGGRKTKVRIHYDPIEMFMVCCTRSERTTHQMIMVYLASFLSSLPFSSLPLASPFHYLCLSLIFPFAAHPRTTTSFSRFLCHDLEGNAAVHKLD